jgi:hypothetical protein
MLQGRETHKELTRQVLYCVYWPQIEIKEFHNDKDQFVPFWC